MAKTVHSLADRYDLAKDRVFLTGTQALVRLVLMQSERDRQAGLNTAGYVTGYRGSPVGTVDTQFMAVRELLAPRNIVFQPGLNEDLAATALWGTQQAEMRGEGRFDGVFGMWYGKGPGVDRSGDVFRHANMAGSSARGGVLVVAGDDHSGESSTVVHASDVALMDAMIPVLSPAGVQEIIDFGLMGYALSRYAGVWAGLKCVHDTVESSAVAEAGPERGLTLLPERHELPEGGLNIRPADDRVPQEERLHMHKIPAVLAFARANGFNRIAFGGGTRPKLGIMAAGKSYLDVRQALDDLGIDEALAAEAGLRLVKIGMVWPLEPGIVRDFAKGLDCVLVVEEKRSVLEAQVRDILYTDKIRPAVIGKTDEEGRTLFAPHGVLDPSQIADAIAARLSHPRIAAAAARLCDTRPPPANSVEPVQRMPYFCAGCPHNSSTVLPEGARGYAGIGCHWLVQFVPGRHTEGATQMGGEGANWAGEAPFSARSHVFQNIGDGTYNHSGLMAIRHAVLSGVNITYKILFNDAVAMTGGQRNDGGLTVQQIAGQMRAAGVERIAVVSDEPGKYPSHAAFPAHVSFHHRDALQEVQAGMTGVPGTSVIIYDQTCAAEKRRRRRRGEMTDPPRRVYINERVCEGCGDCGVQSNCVAIVPVETELGRKRQIDQSVCNKDFSCLKGFCPSFVTVENEAPSQPARRTMRRTAEAGLADPPEPSLPALDRPWSILVAGIGGTGVVTIGHLLGMAAHIEGKGAALIDMVGISQKNGAVVTHLKIGASPRAISAVRVAKGQADLILGCDLLTAASARILTGASRSRTAAVVNSHETMPAQFTHDADFDIAGGGLAARIGAAVKPLGLHAIDATALATGLLGDSIGSNLFMLGYAYQKGLIPVGAPAIAEAVRLNGVAIEMNLEAFAWGRHAAIDETAVTTIPTGPPFASPSSSLDEVIAGRANFLTGYQNADYANRYLAFVGWVRQQEQQRVPDSEALTGAVARALAKLMAYKDEYEVARLYTDGVFEAELRKNFPGSRRVTFHLSPPVFGRRNAFTGKPAKTEFGSWMMTVLRLLARLKKLRGTAFDPFGRTAERRMERALIAEYEETVRTLIDGLAPETLAPAIEVASLPETVRGFGHVKLESVARYRARREDCLSRYGSSGPPLARAAE